MKQRKREKKKYRGNKERKIVFFYRVFKLPLTLKTDPMVKKILI